MKKFLKSFMIIVLAVCSVFGFTACATTTNDLTDVSVAGVKKNGTLVVATNAAFAPFEYIDGTEMVGCKKVDIFKGWDIDVAKEIAKELGVNLEIKNMSFDAALLAPNTGKAHMSMAGITANEERRKSLTFTDKVFDSSQVMIVLENNNTILTPANLQGVKVGAQKGTIGEYLGKMDEDYAYEFDADGNVDLTKPLLGAPTECLAYDTGNTAVMALKSNKVGAVIIDLYPAREFVKNIPGIKIVGGNDTPEAIYNDEYAFAVKLGNTELAAEINKIFAKLTTDGKIAEITAKYFG